MSDQKVERFIQKTAVKIGEEVRDRFEDAFLDLHVDPTGKSPIQQLMGCGLLYLLRSPEHYGDAYWENWFFHYDDREEVNWDNLIKDNKLHHSGICISPEFRIKQFRADFFVDLQERGQRVFGVIECDGHDYHERTKEQATRDKRRDRIFQSLGLVVLRYTGSEIYKDPIGCAESALDSFFEVAARRAGTTT